MKYVALATDINPSYAIYAPVVGRLWRRLGYEPLFALHTDGWTSPFGAFVRAHLNGFSCVEVPTTPPMSVANTMRAVRLAHAARPHVKDGDLILTADVDMAPLSRTFFRRDDDVFVLRADVYGDLARAATANETRPQSVLLAGEYRFALCYVAARARIWRELMPIVPGDIGQSLQRILHGVFKDAPDFDEASFSARLLRSRYAIGALQRVDADTWRQGDLILVPMNHDRRMLIHHCLPTYHDVRLLPPDAIDFHMPRPTNGWAATVIGHYWPEETEFLAAYWPRAMALSRS
jgi:hypothetical protein